MKSCTMASQITNPMIIYSIVYLNTDQRNKFRVTGLCEDNPPETGEFPAQRASTAENVSISYIGVKLWNEFVSDFSCINCMDISELQFFVKTGGGGGGGVGVNFVEMGIHIHGLCNYTAFYLLSFNMIFTCKLNLNCTFLHVFIILY